MEKVYVCIGYGTNKQDNTDYSKWASVVEKSGVYGYYNQKDVFYTDGKVSLGTIKVLSD